MRSISNIAAVTALVSIAAAGDAPVVQNNPIGITYTATLPGTKSGQLSGVVKGAASPDGVGTNLQISFYNLPGGNFSKHVWQSKCTERQRPDMLLL